MTVDQTDNITENVADDAADDTEVSSPAWDLLVRQATMVRNAFEHLRAGLDEKTHIARHFGEPCAYDVAARLLLGEPDPRDLITEWVIELPYQKPPLNLNQHMNFFKRQTIIDALQARVRNAVREADVPHLERVHVELHYRPARNGVRDVDNLVAVLKPALDALHHKDKNESDDLDEDRRWKPIVDGDDPRYVTWRQPVLHKAEKGKPGLIWLVLRSYGLSHVDSDTSDTEVTDVGAAR